MYYGDNSAYWPDHKSWQHPLVRPDPSWPITYGRLSTPAGRKVWYNVGTLCVWSCFIKLIGIQCASSVGSLLSLTHIFTPTFQHQHWIWLSDHHAVTVANDMVTDLGDWLRRWLKKGIQEQSSIAQEALDQCEYDVPELRKQWSDQRSAQLSI